jgi:hypothetical protein
MKPGLAKRGERYGFSGTAPRELTREHAPHRLESVEIHPALEPGELDKAHPFSIVFIRLFAFG